MAKPCVECGRAMGGRVDKLRHPRCQTRVAMQRYRARLKAAGLTANQTFKDFYSRKRTA